MKWRNGIAGFITLLTLSACGGEGTDNSTSGSTSSECLAGSWAGTIVCEDQSFAVSSLVTHEGTTVTYTTQAGAVVTGVWSEPVATFDRSSTVSEGGVTCVTVGSESWAVNSSCNSATVRSATTVTCTGLPPVPLTCTGVLLK